MCARRPFAVGNYDTENHDSMQKGETVHLMKNNQGEFSEDGMEYVVTTPHTPRDWFNFMWNPSHLACAGSSMSGFSLYQNEAGILTNLFGKQDVRTAPRWLYLRDDQTGEFWSAGFLPCHTEHDEYECRHGMGYTVLRTLKNGIRVSFRLFVPRNQSGEVWSVTVENASRRSRRISLVSAADIMLDGMPMPYGYVGGLSASYDKRGGFIFFRNLTHTVVNEKYRAFLYADHRPDGWDVSREHFLGRYQNFARPERVETGVMGNSVAAAEPMIAAMQHRLRLSPGSSRTIHFVLGVVMDRAEAIRAKNALSSGARIEREFDAMVAENKRRVEGLRIQTPDDRLNRLTNVWLKHQLYLMSDWARFYFKGYRDTCQDCAGLSVIDPARASALFFKALNNQRSDGFCPRAFRVASMDIAAADKHYADSPSWISHATDALLRETGDLSLLDRMAAFSDGSEGTVWEHNLRAIEFLWNDRGRHGLSLIHHGDWNDLMDKVGTRGIGESVWMSCALARALTIVGEIARWKGDSRVARKCTARHAALIAAIRRHGWDGKWFIYAINDAGQRIGTAAAKEGRMFINPQAWAFMGGVVDAKQYTQIMRVLEPHVDTQAGPLHNWPPFTQYDEGIGQLTGTPPGFCTNGNVYCHAASFKIAADFDAGRADKAYETLCRILPESAKSEPFAQANGYVGPTAQRMVKHVSDDPWRTGTVAWNFLNIVDRLLGFRREYDGVRISPMLPSDWQQADYIRPFRGIRFEVSIRRGKKRGIWVDGIEQPDNFIRVAPSQAEARPVGVRCVIP